MSSISNNSGSFQRPNMAQIQSKLESLGIPSSVVSQGPSAVQQYAQQHNISLPTPPSGQNSSIFNGASAGQSGMPQPSAEMKEQMESKLESLGIPSSVISQGPEAVMQYAQQNNISLPTPPASTSQSSGTSLDISS